VALFGDITTHLLERAMIGASRRQEALAVNIANANTPGYRRQDVDFHSRLQAAARGGLDSLRATDFSPSPDPGAGPVRADGNSVDFDMEMSEIAQNVLEYQALVAVQRARFKELESVIVGR
jgi:flagellar basal-body rod protein FlgB